MAKAARIHILYLASVVEFAFSAYPEGCTASPEDTESCTFVQEPDDTLAPKVVLLQADTWVSKEKQLPRAHDTNEAPLDENRATNVFFGVDAALETDADANDHVLSEKEANDTASPKVSLLQTDVRVSKAMSRQLPHAHDTKAAPLDKHVAMNVPSIVASQTAQDAIASGQQPAPASPPLSSSIGDISPKVRPPNILFLFADQWRGDWAGFDTPKLHMPTLRALAGRGTRFTHAYTPSPRCEEARVSLTFVQEYHDAGTFTFCDSEPCEYELDGHTWYELLQAAGYHTMTAGQDDFAADKLNELGLSDWIHTLDKLATFRDGFPKDPYGMFLEKRYTTDSNGSITSAFAAGYECYTQNKCCLNLVEGETSGGYCSPSAPDPLDGELYIDNYVTHISEVLLKRVPKEKPWALQVNFPGPHPPFFITRSMKESVAGRWYPAATDNVGTSHLDQLDLRRHYAAEIENLDVQMGKIIETLELTGQLDDTLIVVSSDHGDDFGDHDHFGKKTPWEGASRVPLVIAGPGVAAGRVVDVPVTTLDVIGTFMDSAGVHPSANMSARSLWPLLSVAEYAKRKLEYRTHVTFGFPNWRAVVRRFDKLGILKLVCGDPGYDFEGSIPSPIEPQPPNSKMTLLLFNITADAMDMVEILQESAEVARDMVRLLPYPYNDKCGGSLKAASTKTNPFYGWG